MEVNISEILPIKNQRILCLDVGKKRIGIAISNIGQKIATPLVSYQRIKLIPDCEFISNICIENNINIIVSGLPISMNNSEGKTCQSIRQFMRDLNKYFIKQQNEIKYLMWDERFSTSVMNNFLIKEVNLSRKKRSEVIDRAAAAYILQGVLDYINNNR